MTRVNVSRLTTLLGPWRRRVRLGLRIGPLESEDPRLRVGIAHLGALAAALVITALQSTGIAMPGQTFVFFAIVLGVSALRTLNARRRLAFTTIAMDAVGMVLLVAGTGAPGSPFAAFVLAGAWWAAHLPRAHSGLIYAAIFVAAYTLLVGPQALREHELAVAFERLSALVAVAALSDWFVRVDRRALELNEALRAPPFAAGTLGVRPRLGRALRTLDVPTHVVIAAGHIGLTAIQAELLSYLVLGLTNQEIAEATSLSEPAVRYRLTRLYRAMDVRSRREAAALASELGMAPRAERATHP
jgi:DNA-binding CsgD family transcriptional regulator